MEWIADRAHGLARLAQFAPQAGRRYSAERNYDNGPSGGSSGGHDNVSQLSPYLHAGLLSESEVIAAALDRHSPSACEKFVAEVFWRVYFKGYLEQRPGIWPAFCAGRDAAFEVLENNSGMAKAYERACAGASGIAAFDHWAGELIETGYLHNHARMWFASIWIFTLKLPWELGADLFLRHLIDGDAASNTLSWRWVGGLHTKGKTYLARADNIARYTANMPGGPLDAEGLSPNADPLTEAGDHPRQKLDLPAAPGAGADAGADRSTGDLVSAAELAQPYALLLHDEAAHHAAIDLGPARTPQMVIGAARPDARSPREVSARVRDFAEDAIMHGTAEAAREFGCEAAQWREGEQLEDCLDTAGIERVVVPYLPVGWTRDALIPQIAPLAQAGRVTWLVNDLDRATWPHAKAGFFGVKKKIEGVLDALAVQNAMQGDLFKGDLFKGGAQPAA